MDVSDQGYERTDSVHSYQQQAVILHVLLLVYFNVGRSHVDPPITPPINVYLHSNVDRYAFFKSSSMLRRLAHQQERAHPFPL